MEFGHHNIWILIIPLQFILNLVSYKFRLFFHMQSPVAIIMIENSDFFVVQEVLLLLLVNSHFPDYMIGQQILLFLQSFVSYCQIFGAIFSHLDVYGSAQNEINVISIITLNYNLFVSHTHLRFQIGRNKHDFVFLSFFEDPHLGYMKEVETALSKVFLMWIYHV